MLIYTSGTSGDPKAVKCSQGKVAIAGVTMTQRFGLGPERRLLRVDAVVPFERGAGGLGGGARVRGVRLRCGASSLRRSSFPTSAATARRMRTMWASRCRMCLPHPSARRCRQPAAGGVRKRGRPGRRRAVRPPVRHRGHGRIRFDRGRGERSAARRTPRRVRWARCPRGLRSSIVETGEPCPPGVTGELVNTSDAGRFEGYYNDPEADAERMRGGVYHSGDLAYRDENGYAYFAGRLGDWMRVDGENLGTAPIERVLLRHPDVDRGRGVRDTGARRRRSGDGRAACWPRAPDFDVEEFLAFLAEQPDLGPKQWPSFVRISAELPRTETFKVIKRQLSAEGDDCGDPVVVVAHRGSLRRRGLPRIPAAHGVSATSSNAHGWWTGRQSRCACCRTAAWT